MDLTLNYQENLRTDRLRHPRMAAMAVTLLALFPVQVFANAWLDSFGKAWFYETRNSPNEYVAGSWSEPALAQGKTYNINFYVTKIRGEVALYVGDESRVIIDKTGYYSVDFNVGWGGKQRMVFHTMTGNVVAGVTNIEVTETASGPPRGHYLSFARERNLKHEVLNVLDNPATATNQKRNIADGLDKALTTPGVNGFQITFDWRTIETGDGVYNWLPLDDNIAAAKRYGLAFVVKILDRSFDGSNIMPKYFPPSSLIWTTGGGNSGYVAKRWDPYVYTRIIRLYKAIATRYKNNPSFGGIATTESALGNFSGTDYSVAKYKTALKAIMTQTQNTMTNGKLFWYLNFIRGSNSADLNQDARVDLASTVPSRVLAIGGPDVTPDIKGMPGSVNSYRIHMRKQRPALQQFCHAQHIDLGRQGKNVKDNVNRKSYLDQIAKVRAEESKPGFNGTPAAFQLDDLRTPSGIKVNLHPNWVLGSLWTPLEIFEFADRNYECDYFFWNYVDSGNSNVYGWPNIKPIVVDTQNLYQ